MRRTFWLVTIFTLAACGPTAVRPAPSPEGRWRAHLASPGGELPFEIEISRAGEKGWAASVFNGPEEVPFTSVKYAEGRLRLAFDHYDSVIEAAISDNASTLEGTWQRQAGKRRPSMTFIAIREKSPRIDQSPGMGAPAGEGSVPDITGQWDVTFTDDEETFPALGLFRQEGALVSGTFQTPTGDFRFLKGNYRDGLLQLSSFNGAHAFLFKARVGHDGKLAGDFWSRGSYHATWTARRKVDSAPILPDEFEMTTLTDPSGRLGFTFPDLDGRLVSLSDDRFQGKVVLVDIFGSWCPNSNDEAPLMADLHETYRDRGLEMVGLAYEMTGDPVRDAIFVRRYADRHGIDYPLLLAGTSDKAEASLTLPDLSGVLAFPTAIFIGRDGRVAAIHTGFSGPGTGDRHERLRQRYRGILEDLLGR